MIFCVRLGDDVLYLPFFIYQKSGSVNTVKCSAHKFLFTPYAIFICDLMFFICNERKGQIILFFKLLMFLHRIGTDPYYLKSVLQQVGIIIPQVASLRGTGGRIIMRVKV